MFSENTYVERRKKLKAQLKTGLVLFPGNGEMAMNYRGNQYPFRQDSSFLYFWGLKTSGLVAIIDIDENRETIFGDDFTLDDEIWMGPQKKLSERAAAVGVGETLPLAGLQKVIQGATEKKQAIHFLPQYRAENSLLINRLLGIEEAKVNAAASLEFIRAVVSQRSVKAPEEIMQIEDALEISQEMYKTAFSRIAPGKFESEVAGAVEGIALSWGRRVSFPVIFSVHGETLHNHGHENRMEGGQLAVLDCGVESPLHYASDITRTIPVSGEFSTEQKLVYEIVLGAQKKAIEMIKPEVPFRSIHLEAARTITAGLIDLGLMRGSPDEAVREGAHALFFPHGLGHMLGLDVHDMEGLGENHVGYDDEYKRSDQFGLAYLRLAKRLKVGYVVTVEPGIYFIPQLIDAWSFEKRCCQFINYDRVEEFRTFGGIRIEDDVLVTEHAHRVLGKPIPKSVAEIEKLMGK